MDSPKKSNLLRKFKFKCQAQVQNPQNVDNQTCKNGRFILTQFLEQSQLI